MKKAVLISLIVAGFISSSLMLGALISHVGNKSASAANTQSSTTQPDLANSDAQSGTSDKTYTSAEVSQHNVSSDCWLIIDGGVYDVTSYIPQHPGGAQRIIEYCGQDASRAFDSQHSSYAQQLKENFLIGQLQ